MYAVVSTGGKQLKVEEGTEAVVEKLDAPVGDTVVLDVLFVADGDDIVADAEALKSAQVKAEVVEHFKGEKQIVFKFKRRKGYKRLKGHRQDQTRIKVTGIDAAEAKKAAKKPAKKAKAEAPKAEKAEKQVEAAAGEVQEAAKKVEAKAEEAAAKVKEEATGVAKKVEAKAEEAAAKVKEEATGAAEKVKEKAEAAREKKAAPKKEKKVEPKADVAQCEAVKADGERCKNKAKEGSTYCGVHAKKYEK
jgi:large subunit ribosomal protein L21